MVRIIKKKRYNKDKEGKEQQEEYIAPTFSVDFDENFEKFKGYLEKSGDDVVFREFAFATADIKCGVIFIDGMVSKQWIQVNVISPLLLGGGQLNIDADEKEKRYKTALTIKRKIISAAEVSEAEDLDEAMRMLISGETILLVDGYDKAIVIGTREFPLRGVQEPITDPVIRGPRDGFTEALRFNTALLRRKIKDPNLVFDMMTLGRRSKTDIIISYIKGITNPKLVEDAKKRIEKIDIDAILDSGQLEQLIEDNNISPFPQMQNTERPDKAASALLEGRIVIFVDGTPFVIIAPASLYQFFQSAEDYYERWIIGTLLRGLRWVGSFIATFAPALYVAIVSYHPGMLPTPLALSLAASREGVPFPAFIEALLMETTIELLREAGARLPKPIGQTIGIVGGIIIGDAAVRAGIASPFMVIVVAVTAIASFIIPSYSLAIAFRIIRFPIMILAGTLGLYGVMLAFIIINIHLTLLKSFDANYMSPISPVQVSDWKDAFVRAPIQWMKKRPVYINPVDIDRYEQDAVKEM